MKTTTLVDSPSDTAEKAPDFEQLATDTLRQLKLSFTILLQEIGGVKKSRDVQNFFGVDARLSWQIFKIVAAGPPLRIAPHVPSASSIRRLLEIAEKKRLSRQSILGVRDALASFQHLVETHAGDRVSFDTMSRALLHDDDAETSQNDLQHRKAMFKGHSHYFGAQVQVQAVTLFAHPSRTGGGCDIAQLRTKVGQRRLRSDADLIVDLSNIRSLDPFARLDGDAIDPDAAARFNAPVIPRFSTKPMPQLRTIQPDGTHLRITELSGDSIGQAGLIDLVFGQIWRDSKLIQSPDGQIGVGGQVAITTPTALLNVDLLVHRATYRENTVDSFVSACGASRDLPYAFRPSIRLPFTERLTRIGVGSDVMPVREVPFYQDLVSYLCGELDWDMEQFEVFRMRVEYPIVDTLIHYNVASKNPLSP